MYSISTNKAFGVWKLTRVCWIFTYKIRARYKILAFKHLLQFVQFACVNAVLLRQHTSLLEECSCCHCVIYKVITASFLRHGFEITKCLAFWNILAVSLTPTYFWKRQIQPTSVESFVKLWWTGINIASEWRSCSTECNSDREKRDSAERPCCFEQIKRL